MFDEIQKSDKHEPRWIGLRMLAVGATVFLLALGLCGVGAAIHSQDGVTIVGFYLLLLSGAAMVLAVAVTLVEVVVMLLLNIGRR